jgi:caffeoyl-CoA O-methyltransferase
MSKKAVVIVITIVILCTFSTLTAQRGRQTFGFGGPGQMTGSRGRGQMPGARGPGMYQQAPAPLPADEEEKKILDVLEELDPSRARGMMNVPVADGRFLRAITEAVNAQVVVEIGTSNGYSGIWFCLALRTTGGKLITHEIDAGRGALARENFNKAGVEDIVTLVMGDAHETVANITEEIDILFLDADKEGYNDYLTKLLPLVKPGGLILAHNVSNQGSSMVDYLQAITTNPALETVIVNQQESGISVTLKKRQKVQTLTVDAI